MTRIYSSTNLVAEKSSYPNNINFCRKHALQRVLEKIIFLFFVLLLKTDLDFSCGCNKCGTTLSYCMLGSSDCVTHLTLPWIRRRHLRILPGNRLSDLENMVSIQQTYYLGCIRASRSLLRKTHWP